MDLKHGLNGIVSLPLFPRFRTYKAVLNFTVGSFHLKIGISYSFARLRKEI